MIGKCWCGRLSWVCSGLVWFDLVCLLGFLLFVCVIFWEVWWAHGCCVCFVCLFIVCVCVLLSVALFCYMQCVVSTWHYHSGVCIFMHLRLRQQFPMIDRGQLTAQISDDRPWPVDSLDTLQAHLSTGWSIEDLCFRWNLMWRCTSKIPLSSLTEHSKSSCR